MKQSEIQALIETYDHAYYNLDSPLISDAEYDALKAKLIKSDQEGVPGNALFNKYAHKHKILSLDKVKITEEEALIKHLERLWPVTIQPKLDGLTLVCYDDAQVTRGDGETGENISANCKHLAGMGAYPGFPVRCEAVMLKKDFERLNKERIDNGEEPFKNARNAAAGMLRQKDNTRVQGITVIAYEIMGVTYSNTVQLFDLASRYNWCTIDTFTPNSIEEALYYIKQYDKDGYICDIDGLVIKHIGTKQYGATNHHPNNAIAVKFSAEEKWTKLIAIDYSVGRTGKIVPTAVFEPIELMGSVVSRATLHNKAYMYTLFGNKLSKDMQVCVTKANDIIPAIIGAKHIAEEYTAIQIPTHCPACLELLEQVNDQLFCCNIYCKEKVIAQAAHLASRQALDITGLSEETIRKMYANFKTPPNNYCFPLYFEEKHLLKLEGFAEKSAKKLALEISNKIQNVKLSRFLIACGIPLLGRTASKLIAKQFETLEAIEQDLNSGAFILKNIEGIGKELISNFQKYFWRAKLLQGIIESIISDIQLSVIAENQMTIAITGTLTKPKTYYEEMIVKQGHIYTNSVTKKTTHLVCSDSDKNSTKAQKAIKNKIALIDEETLCTLLTIN